jgi:type I restriction enzyme, R subunit
MSAHAYTEDQQAPRTLTRPLPAGEVVEQPAIGLFAELGWATVSALEETFGATGTLLRETKGEVVLVSRLRAALERLNPALPPEAITAAVDGYPRVENLRMP